MYEGVVAAVVVGVVVVGVVTADAPVLVDAPVSVDHDDDDKSPVDTVLGCVVVVVDGVVVVVVVVQIGTLSILEGSTCRTSEPPVVRFPLPEVVPEVPEAP